MVKRKTRALISRLRESNWSKAFVFLLIVNFVNLSANFYEGNISISEEVNMNDPLDTISELIFEWALDGDEGLIPDNGTQQDDNSIDKIKLAIIALPGFSIYRPLFESSNPSCLKNVGTLSGHFSSTNPPPDRC